MPAIEIAILEPVLGALSTDAGWIGLLIGATGREVIARVRRLVTALRGTGRT